MHDTIIELWLRTLISVFFNKPFVCAYTHILTTIGYIWMFSSVLPRPVVGGAALLFFAPHCLHAKLYLHPFGILLWSTGDLHCSQLLQEVFVYIVALVLLHHLYTVYTTLTAETVTEMETNSGYCNQTATGSEATPTCTPRLQNPSENTDA